MQEKLIKKNIFNITFRVKVGGMVFIGAHETRSTMNEDEIDFVNVMERHLYKWRNTVILDDILMIEKIGEE